MSSLTVGPPSQLAADGRSTTSVNAVTAGPNTAVSFSSNGDARLVPPSAISDSTGVAHTKLIAGTAIGTQIITATSANTATATLTQASSVEVVAVAGSDSALWVAKSDANGNFVSGFHGLGGFMVGAPSATAFNGTVYYVVTGADHDLWIRTDTSGWQRLTSKPVFCIDSPAAIVVSSKLEVGCQAADHSLWHAQSGVFSAPAIPTLPITSWHGLGGIIVAGPGVTDINGQISYAAAATDGNVWLRDAAATWHPWISQGTQPQPMPCRFHPAFGNSSPGGVGGVTYLGCHQPDNSLSVSANNGAGYSDPVNVGGVLVDGVGVAPNSAAAAFFVEGSDGHGWQISVAATGTPNGAFTFLGGNLRYGAGGTTA